MQLPFFLRVQWWKQKFPPSRALSSTPFTKLYKNLDLQLMHTVRSGGFPSWAQARHLPEFLSSQEKKWLGIFLLLAGIGTALSAGNFIWVHHIIKPVQGGEYTEGIIGSPSLINPLFSSQNPVDADLVKLMYSGLFRFDEHLAIQPALAERYELSADGKTYHIFLKKDLKWSDGESLTVDDVSFTLERIQDPDTRSPLILSFQNVVFEKINDQEFTLTLKEPYAPFINFLTTGLLPEHIWQEITPANTRLSSANLKPVGSGSYTLDTLTKDETGVIRSYALKPNGYIKEQSPFIKKLTFKFFPDLNSALDALKTRQIDGLGHLPLGSLDKVNTKTEHILSLETNQYTALFFNPVNQPILKDKKVRTALSYALNRAALLHNSFGQHATLINGPLLHESYAIGGSVDPKTLYNIQEADQLLTDAGWKKISLEERTQAMQDTRMETWLKKNPQPSLPRRATKRQKAAFETQFAAWQKNKETEHTQITEDAQKNPGTKTTQQFFWKKDKTVLAFTLTAPHLDEYQKIAESVADAWRAIGVEVQLNTVEPNRMRADVLKDKNYDVLLYGVILANDPDPFPLWHSSQIKSGGLNLALYSNKTADGLLEKARVAVSLDDRRALYEKFQAILDDEVPAIFLYSPHYVYVMQSGVKGVPEMRLYAPDDRFNSITEWYTKTGWGWKK